MTIASRACFGPAQAPHLTSHLLVRPLCARDLKELALQPAQRPLAPLLAGMCDDKIAQLDDAYAVRFEDRMIGALGLLPVFPGQAMAWALLSSCGPRIFSALHFRVRDFLSERTEHRIEAHVAHDFRAGHRWLKTLGFIWEGCLRAWGPDAQNTDLYALFPAYSPRLYEEK